MLVSHTTQPSPDVSVNEDLVVAGPRFAVVLDGATQVDGVETGCVHDVPWLVARLGGALAYLLLTGERPLAEILADAVAGVMTEHADTCDLANPDSPSTTVSILRERNATVDYLVLADSPVVVRDHAGSVETIVDDRLDLLPGYDVRTVREHRNATGGFWVASTDPEAAAQALAGSFPRDTVDCAGLFSDGASRLAERHGMSWSALLTLLERDGPAAVIDRVRADDDRAAGQFPGKTNDDATAALCRFDAAR